MEYPYLSRIQSPDDLRAMSEDDIKPLADEIRRFLIDSLDQTGGHLASNLGPSER